MFRNLERDEVLAYYRAADIALVTPLRDGMNLVAKEYCAANGDNNGVLILSEFAGAATQLRAGALVVNPHDIEGVANAIYQAYSMSPSERQSRMRRLRQSVAKRDIFWWVNFFLWAATTHSLDGPWPSGQSRPSR
jgi:trehalose 6-phosphate synthase